MSAANKMGGEFDWQFDSWFNAVGSFESNPFSQLNDPVHKAE